MKKQFLIFCTGLLLFCVPVFAQKINLKPATEKLKSGQIPLASDFGFKEYTIADKYDTISFYTYHNPDSKPTSIYLTLPGSDAENISTYHKENDGSYWFNSLTDFDFSYLPDDYLLVIVSKPGFGFCGKSNSKNIPEKYWKFTSLDDRVYRADKALQFIKKNIITAPNKTVVFGYSEGFYVGAKLATVNHTISHLGIGGGGGYADFYDFILFNQKSFIKNEETADTTIHDNVEIIADFKNLILNPSADSFTYGYSNKRWASFQNLQ